MAFTYILYSPNIDKHYIGHTNMTMEARLQKHLSDHKGFTAKTKDWEIAWNMEFDTKAEAYEFESRIKSWKSRRAIENLIKNR